MDTNQLKFTPTPYYCTECGTVLMSRYEGQFVACGKECDASFVDQTLYYIRVGGPAQPIPEVTDESRQN